MPTIERAARELSDALDVCLRARDYRVLPRPARGPILTFLPRRDPAELASALHARGASVGLRGGGIRVSPHAHNSFEHIERLLLLLDELDR